MGEIAQSIGCKAQYEVSRLLKLPQLRADVSRQLLVSLKGHFEEFASAYRAPSQLEDLEQKVMTWLEPQISALMQTAKREAATSKNRKMDSQFSQALCQYLHNRT